MEAVIAIIKNLLKNMKVVVVLGVVLGLILGLIIGWGLWPVKWTNGTPEVLRADLQDDYLRMTIDSYSLNHNQDLAVDRWNNLGEAAGPALARLQAAPVNVDPNALQQFANTVPLDPRANASGPTTPTGSISGEAPPTSSTWMLIIGAVLLIFFGVAAFFIFRLLRNRTGPVTPVMQGAELSRQVEKTDFQSLGLAPPITQTMTTYVLGDDLYDESFSIDTGGGEFLGEYGVGVSETIGVGEPKKVAALEIWLFDKNDIKTATKVLMSEHAYNDPNIRARLEPKGELVVVKPQEQVLLETATLQLLATVVDMDYGTGAMPPKSYFERITLELAVWPRSGQ